MVRILSAAMLVALIGSASSLATLRVVLDTTPPDSAPGFDGGVFIATDVSKGGMSLPDASTWETFCLEANEQAFSNIIYQAAINTAAVLGGTGGGSPDPLDPRTAYLYYTFRTNRAALNGALSGDASFTGTQAQRQEATRQLQEAIWFIEEETPGVNNGLVALANGAGWTTIGSVRVLNLFKPLTTGELINSQDILILVPAPAAVLLGGLGLAGAFWVKRRLA